MWIHLITPGVACFPEPKYEHIFENTMLQYTPNSEEAQQVLLARIQPSLEHITHQTLHVDILHIFTCRTMEKTQWRHSLTFLSSVLW